MVDVTAEGAQARFVADQLGSLSRHMRANDGGDTNEMKIRWARRNMKIVDQMIRFIRIGASSSRARDRRDMERENFATRLRGA